MLYCIFLTKENAPWLKKCPFFRKKGIKNARSATLKLCIPGRGRRRRRQGGQGLGHRPRPYPGGGHGRGRTRHGQPPAEQLEEEGPEREDVVGLGLAGVDRRRGGGGGRVGGLRG